jgi:hypothetical protein
VREKGEGRREKGEGRREKGGKRGEKGGWQGDDELTEKPIEKVNWREFS